jgi:hypothetical protein
MHLGLIDRPFMPHNLISAQKSPVPLLKFQRAPRLKILMSSGSKQGTQVYFLLFSQNPGKCTPNRAPMERDARLQGIFISLKNLIKIPLHKKALRKKRPSIFPKSGAPMEADAHCRALLNISFGVPIKEPSPRVPFMESLAERCPVPRALLRSSFKVPSI